jgi:hypothetical protein
MGQKIALTETFTGTGLPILYDDAIMGAGSLILHDVNHSLGGFAGIPANSATIPNIAWTTANAIVSGAPGQSALGGVVSSADALTAGATSSASFPYAERTPKNGLHLIRSQVNDVAGKQYEITAASAIASYMLANPDHSYYLSIWQYFTRAATTSGSPYPGYAMFGTNTGIGIMSLQVGGAGTAAMFAPGSHNIGYNSVGSGGLITGASLLQYGVNQHAGTIGTFNAIPFQFGGQGGAFSGLHVGPSQIFYRCYLEDLTVSAAAGGYAGGAAITAAQRYAEVQARDLAMYNAANANSGSFTATDSAGNVRTFAATAKLYGDTFTSPAGYP